MEMCWHESGLSKKTKLINIYLSCRESKVTMQRESHVLHEQNSLQIHRLSLTHSGIQNFSMPPIAVLTALCLVEWRNIMGLWFNNWPGFYEHGAWPCILDLIVFIYFYYTVDYISLDLGVTFDKIADHLQQWRCETNWLTQPDLVKKLGRKETSDIWFSAAVRSACQTPASYLSKQVCMITNSSSGGCVWCLTRDT